MLLTEVNEGPNLCDELTEKLTYFELFPAFFKEMGIPLHLPSFSPEDLFPNTKLSFSIETNSNSVNDCQIECH